MSTPDNSTRASRRSAITWMLTASSTIPFLNEDVPAEELATYDLKKDRRREDMWGRSLNKANLLLVSILTDIILPRDDEKPSASDLKIPDFIDEWISAPYERQKKDQVVVNKGLKWITKEARKRFKKGFVRLSNTQQLAICNDISDPATAKAFYKEEVAFFLLLQKLTFGAYFTTEVGKKELGDNPFPTFELPVKKEAGGAGQKTRERKGKSSKKPSQEETLKSRAERRAHGRAQKGGKGKEG